MKEIKKDINFSTIPFYGMIPSFDHNLFMAISLDNKNLLKHLFCINNSFIEFCLTAAEELMVKIQENNLKDLIFNVAAKLLFNIIARGTSDNLNFVDRLKNIILAMLKEPNYPNFFLAYIANDNNSIMYDMILKCFHAPIRQALREIINGCIPYLPDDWNIFILNSLIACIPYECINHWTKFSQFFGLFDDILSYKTDLVLPILVEKDLLFILLDFFLGRQSPFYNSQENKADIGALGMNPDFSNMLLLVADIIKYMKGKNIPISLKSDTCIQQVEFLTRLLKFGALNDELIKIICFNSINKKKYLKQISRVILHILSDYNEKNDDFYANFIQNFLSIDDSFIIIKAEMLVGIPYCSEKSTYSVITETNENIQQDIKYYSSLFLDSSVDPIIELIWNYKTRNELKSMKLMKALLNAANNNARLLDWLSKCPPISNKYKNFSNMLDEILKANIYEFRYFEQKDDRRKIRDSLANEIKEIKMKMLGKVRFHDFEIPDPFFLEPYLKVYSSKLEGETDLEIIGKIYADRNEIFKIQNSMVDIIPIKTQPIKKQEVEREENVVGRWMDNISNYHIVAGSKLGNLDKLDLYTDANEEEQNKDNHNIKKELKQEIPNVEKATEINRDLLKLSVMKFHACNSLLN